MTAAVALVASLLPGGWPGRIELLQAAQRIEPRLRPREEQPA